MTHNAHTAVRRKHAFEAFACIVGAVGDHDHARVQTIADAYAAAVMERNPVRTRGCIEKRIEDRPIRDRIAAVLHRFGFAVRRSNAACIEMIAAYNYRCAQFAGSHHFVKSQPCFRAIAVTEPANACGQTLERNAFARKRNPAAEMHVFREEFEQLLIAARNIRGIAGERSKPERAAAFAKQRTDKRRHETGEIERARNACALRHRANVVAVIEYNGARVEKIDHRLHVLRDSFERASLVLFRMALA